MLYESVDKTCFIPRGESILTPDRLAKGDVSYALSKCGEFLEIQSTVSSVLNYLHEQEIITDDNRYDGQTFEIWQMIWKAAHGLQRTNASLSRGGTGDRFKEYGYSLILRRMCRSELNVVESAIHNLATEHNRFLANSRKATYARAFARLTEVMPAIREKIEALESNKITIAE